MTARPDGMWLLLTAYLLVAGAGWLLRILNLRHLERAGGVVPPELELHTYAVVPLEVSATPPSMPLK